MFLFVRSLNKNIKSLVYSVLYFHLILKILFGLEKMENAEYNVGD